ncbi:hypothetical protein JRO89_XS08G0127800 [Xanthoceras sorbifolium]|uniref:Rhodanese domain-containing protein n=1 Tax=Xanthoceras sorbifolium TaxID=99658 RepID=A0ABQ8HPR9_9ROSI|nr:hypothetical protein JRO89_XS08G0127800 [Xanthoceras sorbifolium]
MGVSWVVFLLLLVISSCGGAEEVVTIDVRQAKDLLRSGNYTYLDVRTVEEYKKGHVDAAKIINIPYMFNTPDGLIFISWRVKNPDFLKEVASLCKEDHPLVVGCQSGVRSLYATTDLLTAVRVQACEQHGRRASLLGTKWISSEGRRKTRISS